MPELTSPLATIPPLLCHPRGYPHTCPEDDAGDFFFQSDPELDLDVHLLIALQGRKSCHQWGRPHTMTERGGNKGLSPTQDKADG